MRDYLIGVAMGIGALACFVGSVLAFQAARRADASPARFVLSWRVVAIEPCHSKGIKVDRYTGYQTPRPYCKDRQKVTRKMRRSFSTAEEAIEFYRERPPDEDFTVNPKEKKTVPVEPTARCEGWKLWDTETKREIPLED